MTQSASATHPAAKLAKSLKPRHLAMISIGGVVGAGLFVGSGAAIAAVGPAVVLSYGLAGVIILFVMRMLGEMVVSHPEVSAFTDYPRLALGSWAGFTTGWLYWYFWVVVVAIEAIAAATILGQWIAAPPWVIGLLLLAAMTGSNLLSTRSYGEFEFWFSTLKVLAIILFILVGASYAFGFTSPHGQTFANLVQYGGFAPKGWAAILAGVTTVIFALSGAEIVTVAAAESEDGAATIASLTTTLMVRILAFYLLSILIIVAIVPWREVRPGLSPFATALAQIGIPGAALIMNGIVLVAVLSCLNSGIYVASRILFTLASHGDAPAWLVTVDRRGVPVRAIAAGMVFGVGGVALSALSPKVVFAFLVNASGAVMIVVYLMIVVAQIKLRRDMGVAAAEQLTLRTWFYPASSYAVGAFMVAVLAAMALTPALASQFYASAGCLAIVLLAYGLRRRTDGVAKRS